MSEKHLLGFLVGILISFACGCGDSDELSIPTDLLKPRALKSQVVFIDRNLHKAYLLNVDPKKIKPEVTEADLPPQPFLVEKRNGADELLVLCAGQQDEEGEEGADAALAVIDSKGHVKTYDIDKGSNSLIQSEDGRYAFIFIQERGEDDPLAINGIFFEQKVVFIDLDREPSEEEAYNSLLLGNSISNVPTGVTFSPEITIAGQPRRLAVIHSTALVWLIDLSTPNSPPISIQPNVGQQFNFEEALFDAKNKRLFLRGSNTDAINVLDLVDDIDAAPAAGILPKPILRDPRLVAQGPSDMALYTLGDRTYLLVVSAGSAFATIIDTDSSTVANVALPVAANRILIPEASEESQSSRRALLYSHGADFKGVTFIDLANINLEGTEREKAESVEAVDFNEIFNRLSVLPNDNYVVLTNSNGSQTSLLDLTERNVYPIKTPSQMKVIVDSRIDKLWFEPQVEDEDGDRLLYLDLETFSSEDVRLDEKIDHVILVGDESNPQIAVVHPSSIGYVTVLDAESPNRDEAVSVEGFFMSDVLDRGEQ